MDDDPVQSTLDSLHAELAVLQAMLKKQTCRYAWLANLPITDVENPFPSVLQISEISGRKSSIRDTAGKLWSELSYTDSSQDNKNTIRTAGLIVLEADAEQQVSMTFQCYLINRLKKQLREEVSQLTPTQRKRLRVGKNRRINPVQAYRRINVFARPVSRFRFGWAINSSTMYNTSVSAFKHHLSSILASPQTTPDERAQALQDINVLDTYPDGPLVRRRRVPPTPIVSVSVSTDSKPIYFKRSASSPLLCFIEPTQALPRVNPLDNCVIDYPLSLIHI